MFLRAETMDGLFTHLEENLIGSALHERSHGEAFLDCLRERAGVRGMWVLDGPESALSFDGCMALTVLLGDVLAGGSQVILSTHSPLLAAVPGLPGAVPAPPAVTGDPRLRGGGPPWTSRPVAVVEENVHRMTHLVSVVFAAGEVDQDAVVPARLVPEDDMPVFGIPLMAELDESTDLGLPRGEAVDRRTHLVGDLPRSDLGEDAPSHPVGEAR